VSVVSNTGPLIALAKADSLDLLRALFGTVLIPHAVQRELFAKGGIESRRLDEAMASFIQVASMADLSSQAAEATENLGPGEQQAIALAASSRMLLIIDERLGRSAARRLGVRVTGTIGVLLEAKQRTLIGNVLPVLQRIRLNGYWLSDELVRAALVLAGEA
jgi:uncharacterized protein